MKQTKKGNHWYFGMKAHIGEDAQSGLVHTVAGNAANVNDLNMAGALLHGDGRAGCGPPLKARLFVYSPRGAALESVVRLMDGIGVMPIYIHRPGRRGGERATPST